MKSDQKEDKISRITLIVPTELHQSFKSLTAINGSTMTDTLLEFIKKYVSDHGKPKKGK